MRLSDIAAMRLHNHQLLSKLDDPLDVLRHYGAMQAQDYKAAKWALGLRSDTTDAELNKLFDEGKFFRVHMLRPTWHFVLAEDIRWIQELTGERVLTTLNHYYRKLNLDNESLQRVTAKLANVLRGGNALSHPELREFYASHGFETTSMHLSFLTIYARTKGIICSGPMQGKQHTVMLMDDRVPAGTKRTRDEALGELVRRFFTTHGPATTQDFAWWSSMLAADIKRGIEIANLQSMVVEGKTFYYAKEASMDVPSPVSHLLPNFDEYTVAYKERRPFVREELRKRLSFENMSFHQVIVDGQLVGNWRWSTGKNNTTVTIDYFDTVSRAQKHSVKQSAKQLSTFLGQPVAVEEAPH